jgi:hypothetical protein
MVDQLCNRGSIPVKILRKGERKEKDAEFFGTFVGRDPSLGVCGVSGRGG